MIQLFIGPEGAGKTALMTGNVVVLNNTWLRTYGIKPRIAAFPGYELLDQNKKVVSEIMYPQDWLSFPEELSNIIIAIDEIDIFFNHYEFMALMSRLFTWVIKQRRKRNIVIFGTLQNYELLVKDLRRFIWLRTFCWDQYWSLRAAGIKTAKRGEVIITRTYDNLGFFTGRPGTPIFPDKEFRARPFWENFKTEAVINPYEGMRRVKVDREEIKVGKDGQVTPAGPQINTADIDSGLAEQLGQEYGSVNINYDQSSIIVGMVLEKWREQNINSMPVDKVRQVFQEMGLNLTNKTLGVVLKSQGAEFKPGSLSSGGNKYVF